MEKHFGKVLDVNGEDSHSVLNAYEKYGDTVEYIRWYPDPEGMSKYEYWGMIDQSEKIGKVPYLTNSPEGFINVQNKELAFARWKEAGINCPDFFVYKDKEDFYKQHEANPITFCLDSITA